MDFGRCADCLAKDKEYIKIFTSENVSKETENIAKCTVEYCCEENLKLYFKFSVPSKFWEENTAYQIKSNEGTCSIKPVAAARLCCGCYVFFLQQDHNATQSRFLFEMLAKNIEDVYNRLPKDYKFLDLDQARDKLSANTSPYTWSCDQDENIFNIGDAMRLLVDRGFLYCEGGSYNIYHMKNK